ncbi:DNA-3-methyladenine glycosylase [Microlunatus sp. Y2014]|uniref:DNA-3-methyladenine glycosylase n=1 Tax=Microlunatus sp. Y2014 TaxID=3418488 RepID=UPI003DA74B2F
MALPVRLATASAIDWRDRALDVAPRLLGAVLSCGPVSIMLTEVEAYEGGEDPASHAWRGITPRTQVMFGPPQRLYVYLSHGIHHAMNLVCGPEGTASAVLLRAGRVVAGEAIARDRRPGVDHDRLARGPGCLTRALGVDRTHDGADLVLDTTAVRQWGGVPEPVADVPVDTGPRVGVSRAADRPWRFWWAGHPTVSTYRRAKSHR